MIIVGVCGGIAAYKTCDLVRLLVTAGHEVQVIQTRSSTEFVGPTTFAALSRRPVLTDDAGDPFPHLQASGKAELMAIAPLTATSLARLAHGEAASVLTASALAFTGPLVVAPAMNPRMWAAPATRANLDRLLDRGVEVIGPGVGDTAEGEQGEGRMAEPAEIAAAVTRRLASAAQPGRGQGAGHCRRHPRAAGRRALHRQPLQRPDGRGPGRRGRPPWSRRDAGAGGRHRPPVRAHACA